MAEQSESTTAAASDADGARERAGALAEFRVGWPIVLVAAIGLACGLGALPIYSLGALTKPMADDLGWSRAEVQAIFTWLTIGNLVAAPALGWWLDRHGVRGVTLWSTLAMAAGFALIGLLTRSPATAYVLAFATAMLGVATTPIAWTRAIVGWFDVGRGQALGRVGLEQVVEGPQLEGPQRVIAVGRGEHAAAAGR